MKFSDLLAKFEMSLAQLNPSLLFKFQLNHIFWHTNVDLIVISLLLQITILVICPSNFVIHLPQNFVRNLLDVVSALEV